MIGAGTESLIPNLGVNPAPAGIQVNRRADKDSRWFGNDDLGDGGDDGL